MGWLLRSADDQSNPTLSGGVYYVYITIGKAVYWRVAGANIIGIIFISDGGQYGLDAVSSFEYKGGVINPTDYNFHRGTFTKQIDAKTATLNATTDFFTSVAHGFINTNQVRLRAVDGSLPPELVEDILGQSNKYYIVNKTDDTFQLSLTSGGAPITFANNATNLRVWKADAGFDDPDQGLPEYAPEVETTFNNIAYIEFNHNFGSTDEPDWQDFRIFGTGRRLMDYDADGNETGVVSGSDLLGNPALIIADNYLYNYKGDPDRIDWTSWFALRTAANVEILDRVNTTETSTTSGLIGRYYQGTVDHPTYPVFTHPITSRLDATIDVADSLPTTAPASGVNGYGFSVIWKGQIKPEFTENYTLKFEVDDGVEVFINGSSILNVTTVGTHTVTYSFNADQLYDIEIRYYQKYINAIGNHYKIRFLWSSASQAEEIVPADRLFPADEIVKRYLVSLAFNTPTEASEVHERIMERTVGWDWTDDNGLIKFLPPDRSEVFTFRFDRLDDDSKANFVSRSFEKKRRSLPERENFKLGRYRKLTMDTYPFQFVQADREELRLYTNGEPSNSPYTDIGVMTQSQAQRFLEMEMVLKTDPDHVGQIAGGLASSIIRKCQWVRVFYVDEYGEVVNRKYVVTFHGWGDSVSRNDFSLLPIPEDPDDFYFDEPVES